MLCFAGAVEIKPELYRVYPVQYCSDLAAWHYNCGISLCACGPPGSARDADAEVVELMRELYRAHPNQYITTILRRGSKLQLDHCRLSEDAREAAQRHHLHPNKCCSDLAIRLSNYSIYLSASGLSQGA